MTFPMQLGERRALICSLVKAMREEESWVGETHIQKCVYFLQEMLRVPVGYDYILYKHGPYCFDLQRELAVMRSRRQLNVESRFPYGPSIRLGPRGEVNLDRVRQHSDAVRFVAGTFSTRDVRELERLSTALFVTAQNPGSAYSHVVSQMRQIKPHIDDAKARQAVNEITQLRTAAERSR